MAISLFQPIAANASFIKIKIISLIHRDFLFPFAADSVRFAKAESFTGIS